ncbi:hypothetical protein TCAP_01256 [Tolypocladium capitatum]|uniref:Uncharacterized protein n=1 Tax=Tolypocladium capitatum TaxID=45235 RepID=A0A2K3QMR3_9HYPO|nr:hypothetical protein TCAP_01256 [Tolypocladium capitatum]
MSNRTFSARLHIVTQAKQLLKHLVRLGPQAVVVHDVRLKHLDAPDQLGRLPGEVIVNVHVLDVRRSVHGDRVVAQLLLIVQGVPVGRLGELLGDVAQGDELRVRLKVQRVDHLAGEEQRFAGRGAGVSRVQPREGLEGPADAVGSPVGGPAGPVAVDGLVEDGVDDVGVKGGEGLEGLQGGAGEEAELVEGSLEVQQDAVDVVEAAVAAKGDADSEQTGHGQGAARGERDTAALPALDVGSELTQDSSVLGELGKVLEVALGRLAEGCLVDLVGRPAHGGQTTGEENLAKTLWVHGQVRQADEAAVGLAKDGPGGLSLRPTLGEALPDGLAVADGVVLAHEPQVARLGVRVADLGEHSSGDRRAHADATVVEVEHLVAAGQRGARQRMVLGLAIAEAGPALEVDHVRLGGRLPDVAIVGGEDGQLALGGAAAEDGDGGGGGVGVVEGHAEEELGDEKLAGDDVALAADELGGGNGYGGHGALKGRWTAS